MNSLTRTPEEDDLLERSTKKTKTIMEESRDTEHMVVEGYDAEASLEPRGHQSVTNTGQRNSFKETLLGRKSLDSQSEPPDLTESDSEDDVEEDLEEERCSISSRATFAFPRVPHNIALDVEEPAHPPLVGARVPLNEGVMPLVGEAQGSNEPRDREPEAHLYLVHIEGVEARRRAMSPLVGMGENYLKFTHGSGSQGSPAWRRGDAPSIDAVVLLTGLSEGEDIIYKQIELTKGEIGKTLRQLGSEKRFGQSNGAFEDERLTTGDTPDTPLNHLGTRGPSAALSTSPTSSKARALKRRTWSSGAFPEVWPPTRELPEHLRYREELIAWGSGLSSGYLPRTPIRRAEESFLGTFPEITEYLIRPRFPSSLYCSRFLSRALPDLSIGGASPDTLPAPSDECFVVAAFRRTLQFPTPNVPEVLDLVIALD
ncbi:endo-1,3(4)-beta-glucanase 1-like [Dorcoceras hygrometricum]|uniref:Endo-1,3(4)-beta-glucanase 1-like n=1 Tax=Dorcoceras hygrometricum TaxID=472368 RepID=A0A2Z7BMF7_9LAMI|nr:endo-1,3(4)-beta-glucanase 1-like [Dorcoceras hygrometricum]